MAEGNQQHAVRKAGNKKQQMSNTNDIFNEMVPTVYLKEHSFAY
jgi:hypothetical protein